jgi:hypothetical protein
VLHAERRDLELFGCFGTEAERSRRDADAKNALVDRFTEEAQFNCNVIWTLMENHFKHEEDLDSALDAAMTATENRVKDNGAEILPSVLDNIRTQYRAAIVQTASDRSATKSIRRSDGIFKMQFLASCRMQTVQAMKLQAGVD